MKGESVTSVLGINLWGLGIKPFPSSFCKVVFLWEKSYVQRRGCVCKNKEKSHLKWSWGALKWKLSCISHL